MDRTERIAGEMRRALSDILRNDLKDPRIPTVTSVTNIKLAKDLKYAKVYISIYAGEKEKKAALAALQRPKADKRLAPRGCVQAAAARYRAACCLGCKGAV